MGTDHPSGKGLRGLTKTRDACGAAAPHHGRRWTTAGGPAHSHKRCTVEATLNGDGSSARRWHQRALATISANSCYPRGKRVGLSPPRNAAAPSEPYSPPVPVLTVAPSSDFSRSLVKHPAQVKTVRPPTLRVLPPRMMAGCLQVPQSRVQLPATERLRGVAVC